MVHGHYNREIMCNSNAVLDQGLRSDRPCYHQSYQQHYTLLPHIAVLTLSYDLDLQSTASYGQAHYP